MCLCGMCSRALVARADLYVIMCERDRCESEEEAEGPAVNGKSEARVAEKSMRCFDC